MDDVTLEPIQSLGLPPRAERHLCFRGIATVGDLASKTEGELISMRQIGPCALAAIREALSRHGLRLRWG